MTIRITVEDLKLRAFLTWLEGGHLALNGEIVPLLLAFSQSLDNSELAGCRIANSAVSLSDSRGQQFDVVRVEEDLKGIPKVDIHTGAFTLACTKLEPGATFTWADIIKSTRGFLKIQPIDVR